MLERLRDLIAGAGGGATSNRSALDDLQLATAALLVEAAVLDGTFDNTERMVIAEALACQFDLDSHAVDLLIDEAQKTIDDNTQLYGITRTIKNSYPPEDRVRIIEMLWEVAYADGTLHDYEASLVRRVAGLIYVPDRDSGAARQRVLARYGLASQEEP